MPKDCYVYSDPTSNFGKGYFVHVGVNEDKAIERAIEIWEKPDELFLTFLSRYIWVDEKNGSIFREAFLQQAHRMKEFTIIPVGQKDESKGVEKDNLLLGFDLVHYYLD